jgi:hypothetical protein
MDFNEFRSSGIQRFLRGNAQELTHCILDNNLNKMEREFLADFVQSNIPRESVSSGPKPNQLLRIRATLIRFWQGHDGFKKKSGISEYIGSKLDCSRQRIDKILKPVDKPKTVKDFELAFLIKLKISEREQAISWGDDELISFYREQDLQPVIK